MCVLCLWCVSVLNFNRPSLLCNLHFIVLTGQNHQKFKKKMRKASLKMIYAVHISKTAVLYQFKLYTHILL